jgi:hypothetical protein
MTSAAPHLDVALAAGSTLIAAAFSLSTLDRWLRRRRPQELAWSISLALFALGAGALWWGFARGWSTASFRVFYFAGAIANVPWLALGTVYLVWDRSVGDRIRTALVFLTGLAAGVLFTAPIEGIVPRSELPEGRELFGAWPRVLAAVGSGVAAVVIIVGAVWTTVRFVRSRSAPRHRVAGNVLIAVGTLVLSASGTLAGRLGKDRGFVVTLAVGITILFIGFLVSTGRQHRPQLTVVLDRAA